MLRVYLPQPAKRNDPTPPPILSIPDVIARHAWLDHHMQVIGYPPIANEEYWRRSGLLLGQAVYEVIQQFQLNPPEIRGTTGQSQTNQARERAASRDPSTASSAASTSSSSSDEEVDAPVPLKQIEDMAVENLAREHDLRELQEKVTEVKAALKTKTDLFKKLERKHVSMGSPFDTTPISKEYEKSMTVSYQNAEKMSKSWLKEGGDVKDFCDAYIEERSRFHSSKAKLELLTHNL